MRQLSGMDNFFYQLENNRHPMHVASLGIYDPSTAPGGKVRFKTILDFFAAKAADIPFFRSRVVKPPLGLDRPYWVEEGSVDVEFHVRHVALPEPGDWRQLMIQVARLHSRSLDMRRPLWEAYVIEGLDNIEGIAKGSFALYLKMHHSGVDGTEGTRIFSMLHSLTAEFEPKSESKVVLADRDPSELELSVRSVIGRSKRLWEASRVFAELGPKLLSLNEEYGEEFFDHLKNYVNDKLGKGDPEHKTHLLPGHIHTRFDAKVSPHRVIDALGLPFDECQKIRKHMPVTFNDIFLATVGGGLRKYLTVHHELPDVSVNCLMPLAATGTDRSDASSNNITLAALPIHTEIEDPIERLLAVKKSSARVKQQQELIGRGFVNRLMNVTPFPVTKTLLDKALLGNASVTVSNVRGPEAPVYVAGARMQMFLPVSVTFDGVGLNVTGFSCNNVLWLCLVACRAMLPDPGFLTQCLKDAFDEIVAASEEWGKKAGVKTAKSPVKGGAKRSKPKGVAAATRTVKRAVSRKAN